VFSFSKHFTMSGATCNKGVCSKNTPSLSDAEIQEFLGSFPNWSLVQADDGSPRIHRTFVARNFMAAMNFLNSAANIAEELGHHPDLHLTEYRKVKVVVWTHAIRGLAKADFELAGKLDQVEVDYSPKWLKTNQKA